MTEDDQLTSRHYQRGNDQAAGSGKRALWRCRSRRLLRELSASQDAAPWPPLVFNGISKTCHSDRADLLYNNPPAVLD